jgi:hypothetical protein
MRRTRISAAIVALAGLALLGAGCSKSRPSENPSDEGPTSSASPAPTQSATPRKPSTFIARPTGGPSSTAPAASQPTIAELATQLATTPEMVKMIQRFGTQVVGATIKGPVIDIEFQVIEPEKARPVLFPDTERYLIDAKTGTTLRPPSGPRGGLVRPVRELVGAGRYVASFTNPGGQVKSGDKVSLVVGDFRVDNVIVK